VASSGPAPTGPCLSCAEAPELDAGVQVGSHHSRIPSFSLLTMLRFMQPRIWLAFWAVS